MSNQRDTQFVGFAALELQEIDDAIGRIVERFSEQKGEIDEKKLAEESAHELGMILARRAYDLVCHAIANVPVQEQENAFSPEDDKYIVHEHIPDMTTLLKEEEVITHD